MSDVQDNPVFDTIQGTCSRWGIRPAKLYEVLGEKRILAKKFGKRILIDQRSVREYFDSLPSAEIKPSARARRRAEAAA
jgi:hypothetical protein